MPLLANKKYVLSKIDGKEYCLVNGHFRKHVLKHLNSIAEYLEQFENVSCRCKYCRSYANVGSGLIPKDTCGSTRCAKAARALAIRNTAPAIRKHWNAINSERRRMDKDYAAKINAKTHAGNLKIGEDGLTGYERAAKKRRETLFTKHGNEYWANTAKTKQTWTNKSDEEKDRYAAEVSRKQRSFSPEKRKEITDRVCKHHLEKYGTACPANIGGGFSKISTSLFEAIALDSAIFKPKHEKEKLIGRSCVDFCIGDKVIEFYGDYWHANPKVYDAGHLIQRKKMMASDIWAKDAERVQKIEESGYKVKIVWEREFRRHPERVIKECREWLSNT